MITETHIFRNGETEPALSWICTQKKKPLALCDAEEFSNWTKLSNHQCPNCPLKEPHSWCPAAVAIALTVAATSSWQSTENVTLEIISGNRRITETTTASEALSPIFMNQIVHSACPLMKFDFWFWKFFSADLSVQNVLFRRLAIDLICNDFSKKRGVEFSSSRISTEELISVLKHLMDRIRELSTITGDAAPNAFAKLSTLESYSSWFKDEIYDHIESGLHEHKSDIKRSI